VGGGPSACNAPTILEEDLQAAVVKAINMVLASRSTVIEDMKQVIDKVLISEIDEQIQSIDRKMSEISKEIVNRVSANLTYEDLADQMGDLREEKQKLLVEQAEDNGKQRMKEVLISFLNEQDVEIKEFDENLVRKLIEQVIIHEDGTLTVEFKSGTKVVVETKKETES
jgi:S-adenosylmethionine synthetase